MDPLAWHYVYFQYSGICCPTLIPCKGFPPSITRHNQQLCIVARATSIFVPTNIKVKLFMGKYLSNFFITSDPMSVDYPSPWTGGLASVKGVGQPHPPPSVGSGELLPHKIPKIEGLNYHRHMYTQYKLVEQPPCKQKVVGSSPTQGSLFSLQKGAVLGVS